MSGAQQKADFESAFFASKGRDVLSCGTRWGGCRLAGEGNGMGAFIACKRGGARLCSACDS